MRRIRIMHVVRTLATGGTETVVRKLVSALDSEKFQQSVCTVVASPGPHPLGTICLNRPPGRSAFLVPQLMRVFRQERPDIVHSRNWATIEAVMAAKLAGIAGIVHSEHGRDVNTIGPQPWRRRALRRISYACADRVFCVSEELRQHYCQQLGMKKTAFDVIPNGVDVDQFRPNAEARKMRRAELGANTRTIVVGTVGRLDPVKDQATLVRAAAKALKKRVDLRLVIVGDGPQRAALESELEHLPELAQYTTFTGDVNNVADWLNAFDIFVLPSLSEGMSNTLLEAMAVGIAPIATAVGGNIEVVEHGKSGFLVQPGGMDEIGNHIVQLAATDERRNEIGQNARQRVANYFNIDRTVRRYEEMYSELMQSRHLLARRQQSIHQDSYVRNLRNL